MEIIVKLLPSAGTLAALVVSLIAVHWFLNRDPIASRGNQFRNQSILLALTAVGALLLILVIPIGDAMRGQLLSLIGIVVSAAIALSSTTFLSNAMAGVMMRAVRNFRIGDFIQSGEHFGRVSERGLFHTEIQTADRDLTTLPNMFLVTNPVTTIRSSGTIVSATVSLGYDVSRNKIEKLLLDAALSVDLSDPFVHVKELGDFSVLYSVHGLLTEVKRVLSVRSQLRCAVLDHLHLGKIEIVSPNFMNQRVLDPKTVFIPRPTPVQVDVATAAAVEDLVFDKAEEAESIEALRTTRDDLQKQLAALKEGTKEADEAGKERLEKESTILRQRVERLDKVIAGRHAKVSGND